MRCEKKEALPLIEKLLAVFKSVDANPTPPPCRRPSWTFQKFPKKTNHMSPMGTPQGLKSQAVGIHAFLVFSWKNTNQIM
jgi:hypothetical protein